MTHKIDVYIADTSLGKHFVNFRMVMELKAGYEFKQQKRLIRSVL